MHNISIYPLQVKAYQIKIKKHFIQLHLHANIQTCVIIFYYIKVVYESQNHILFTILLNPVQKYQSNIFGVIF